MVVKPTLATVGNVYALMPWAEYERLRARIAELKAECDETTRKIDYLASNEVVILTEQVDAAWVSYMERQPTGAVLRELGIDVCEKCGGHGSWTYQRDCQEAEAVVTEKAHCPACHRNGKPHGWVWRNDE